MFIIYLTKVKGVSYSELLSNHTFANLSREQQSMYERIWDEADYVIPPSENNAFFVMTNIVITPNQTRGKCPEDHIENPKIICTNDKNGTKATTTTKTPISSSTDNIPRFYSNNSSLPGKEDKDDKQHKCIKGRIYGHKSHGKETGSCIKSARADQSEDSVYACEISGWCPVELDMLAMKNIPLIQGTEKLTVLIKNAISFPWFGKYHRNNRPNGICMFKPNKESTWLCPIFRLGDIVELAGGFKISNTFFDLTK